MIKDNDFNKNKKNKKDSQYIHNEKKYAEQETNIFEQKNLKNNAQSFDFLDEKLKFFDNEEPEEIENALETFGTDITALASEGKIDECFGREKELEELMEILIRRQKNNPVLVGEPGVGKTAIIELFAAKLINNTVPFVLEGRSIISIDLARIVAGSRYRGEFEQRFQKILDELFEQPHIIMFIDEIHTLCGAGSAEGSLDAANILKPALSRPGFQCIGATTTKEYQKIEKDAALNRRFQPVRVNEPSIEETLNILYGIRPTLESFHNVTFLPGTLKLAAELSSRYIYDRFLPDKAIDIIDRAGAKEVLNATSLKPGSIVRSIVDSALVNLGKLKNECYRRGDLASLYILQEVELAYRKFLLEWVEDPLQIPLKIREKNLSPLAGELFEKIKLSTLKHVQDLFFASTLKNLYKKEKNIFKKKILYSLKLNIFRSLKFIKPINKKALNIENISFFIFDKINNSKNYLSTSIFNIENILEIELNSSSALNIIDSLRENNNGKLLVQTSTEKKTHKILKKLGGIELSRFKAYSNFLKNLRPLVKRGLIESLSQNSNLKISSNELLMVQGVLGFLGNQVEDKLAGIVESKIAKNSSIENNKIRKREISAEDIKNIVSKVTGIPLNSISSDESQKLANLEKELHKRVIGQEAAISAIARAVRRSRLGIQNPNRPIASFMFCGPTGVGKTEVTKAIAVSLFGSENDLIRFDMSEFMEKFAISRLIGSPPGYVGYEDGGELADAVKRKPYSVVLFDEVEKAHPEILNILLQILEDGRLTDAQKRLIPFENTVIIMTSNAGASEIQNILNNKNSSTILVNTEKKSSYKDAYAGTIEFLESPITKNYLLDIQDRLAEQIKMSYGSIKNNKPQKDISSNLDNKEQTLSIEDSRLKEAVLGKLSSVFLPEFLNRLDEVIIFRPLTKVELKQICEIMISQVAKRLIQKNIFLEVEESVKNKLTSDAYNPAFGARPLRRLVTKFVEDLVSEFLLKKEVFNTKEILYPRIFLGEKEIIKIEEVKRLALPS